MTVQPTFTDWEPAWGGILRRFPIDKVPTKDQPFTIVRSEIETNPPRETVLEWRPAVRR